MLMELVDYLVEEADLEAVLTCKLPSLLVGDSYRLKEASAKVPEEVVVYHFN